MLYLLEEAIKLRSRWRIGWPVANNYIYVLAPFEFEFVARRELEPLVDGHVNLKDETAYCRPGIATACGYEIRHVDIVQHGSGIGIGGSASAHGA
jgi:hypothetical protein